MFLENLTHFQLIPGHWHLYVPGRLASARGIGAGHPFRWRSWGISLGMLGKPNVSWLFMICVGKKIETPQCLHDFITICAHLSNFFLFGHSYSQKSLGMDFRIYYIESNEHGDWHPEKVGEWCPEMATSGFFLNDWVIGLWFPQYLFSTNLTMNSTSFTNFMVSGFTTSQQSLVSNGRETWLRSILAWWCWVEEPPEVSIPRPTAGLLSILTYTENTYRYHNRYHIWDS